MARPWEIIGEIVDDVRQLRNTGISPSEIVRRLRSLDLGTGEISNYLGEAFCLHGGVPGLDLLEGDDGYPNPEAIDRWYVPAVDAAREEWLGAGPYPDLMRRRDRHVFRAVARRSRTTIVVRAACRAAARHIGRAGFRPCPVHLWGVPRTKMPHAGLIAADPADASLCDLLAAAGPSMSYARYVEDLEQLGFHVGTSEEGHVVHDENRYVFYPGYFLHGVYNEQGVNAWTDSEGERLRTELNRRLGEDLVQHGPHDIWDQRRGGRIAPFLARPQLPVLFFMPDGDVRVCFDTASMAADYRFLDIAWDSLYPAQAAAPGEPLP